MVNDTSISATDEEIEDIKWTFRRTRSKRSIGGTLVDLPIFLDN